MQPLLKIDYLSCERNGILLFENLSFNVMAGELVHVTGSNGSGKTTLLRMLSGIGFDDRGCIKRQNAPILYIGHKLGIKALLSPMENLRWYFPSCADAEIRSALNHWGLSGYENRPCGRLSAGQQQRVALSRLLLSKDRLWVLDEPFTSLDVTGVQKLESLIRNHLENNGAAVITTHHHLGVDNKFKKIALAGSIG